MVRRSGVAGLDGGTESAVYDDESSVKRGGTAKAPWIGAGGRWTVWPMRVVLWVAILVIGYRGVMAIILNETPTTTVSGTPVPASTSPSSQFPVTLAEAYALQFGQVYLNFSPGTAAQRQQKLAEFIPQNVSQLNPQFGWNSSGSAHLDQEQVAGIDVRGNNSAVVTILAEVDSQRLELGVPVYASGGGLVVSGQPAILPAPPQAQLPSAQPPASDQNAQSALMSQLPPFFQAYASGDQTTLNRFLAPGISITGLGGAVRYGSIGSITAPQGGQKRDITATVNWLLPGSAAQLTTTYDMTVVDQQSGKWYVEDIRASTQPMGTQ